MNKNEIIFLGGALTGMLIKTIIDWSKDDKNNINNKDSKFNDTIEVNEIIRTRKECAYDDGDDDVSAVLDDDKLFFMIAKFIRQEDFKDNVLDEYDRVNSEIRELQRIKNPLMEDRKNTLLRYINFLEIIKG